MTTWTTETLENCLEVLLDYRGKSPTKSEWGIPVLSAKVVKTAGLLRPIEQTIAPDYYPKWMTRGYPKPGDVVMTTEAPLGEVIQLDEETASFGLGQRLVCLRGKANKLDNTFLRYLLTSPGQQEVLASRATGTTVLGISQKALRAMPITFPNFSEQRRIGELLASLDDKIELNRKMNATLESTARALFRDWFIDFGPTRAKMEARASYLSPDLWHLFPDCLDDEGKPEGWKAGILGDVATAKNEGVDPASIHSDTPYIGLEHMPRGSIALNDWEGAGKVSSNKAAFAAGDFLFGKLRPYFHKVGIAPVSGICSTDIVVVRPRSVAWAGFVIACISDDDFVAYTDKTSTGTKMPRTSWTIMSKYPMVLPPSQLAEAFNATIGSMLESIRANIKESRTLAQTRDLLLPRLMSGDLRVLETTLEQEVGA